MFQQILVAQSHYLQELSYQNLISIYADYGVIPTRYKMFIDCKNNNSPIIEPQMEWWYSKSSY